MKHPYWWKEQVMTLGLLFCISFFLTVSYWSMMGKRNNQLALHHRYFEKCYRTMHLPQPHILAKPVHSPHRTVLVPSSNRPAGRCGSHGSQHRLETVLTPTIDKLAECAFPKPAWLISRAACRLLIGLVLMRTDAWGWPAWGQWAQAEPRVAKAGAYSK